MFAVISFLITLFQQVPVFSDLWFPVGNLVIGLLLLGFAVFTNFDALRERARSGEVRRAGRYGTSAILQTLLGIALLCMLAFLSTRYHEQWDWTEARSHSLTDQTVKVLADLDADVNVTAVYAAIASMPARELLDRYAIAAPERFHVEYIDPQAQPGRVSELGLEAERLEGGLLHVEIEGESVDVLELTESELTNALVKLTRRESKKVYFLIGHNERSIEGEATEGSEFQLAAEALRNETYEVETLLLAATGAVPADADVVIAAGPTRPYHEAEHAALADYLAGGGSLLVLLDPRAKTDLGDDLAEWGVEIGDDVIVDRVQGLFGRPTTPFAAEYADHPITAELGDATMFHTARSVNPAPSAEGALQWIVRTSEGSFAERDMERLTTTGEAEFDEADLLGPVAVAVAGNLALGEAAEGEEPVPARLVVVGDSDFATNQLVGEFRNRDLFLNSVNWLLGDVEAISIRPGEVRASRLQLSAEQFLQIRVLSLFVLPQLIALAGVLAWWWRRRAPGR